VGKGLEAKGRWGGRSIFYTIEEGFGESSDHVRRELKEARGKKLNHSQEKKQL